MNRDIQNPRWEFKTTEGDIVTIDRRFIAVVSKWGDAADGGMCQVWTTSTKWGVFTVTTPYEEVVSWWRDSP